MSHYARRVDSTHTEVGTVLRSLGFSTIDTHKAGDGFPDWVAGKNRVTLLVEVVGSDHHPHTIREHEERRLGWKGGIWLVVLNGNDLLNQLQQLGLLEVQG